MNIERGKTLKVYKLLLKNTNHKFHFLLIQKFGQK